MDTSRRDKRIITILMIFTVIFTFFGASLAYWNWETSESQKTNIVFTLTKEFSCAADGGGNITDVDAFIAPSKCTSSTHAIKREVKVTPTIFGEHTVTMDLWLDINAIDEGLSNSKKFKYALTTNANSCTDGLINGGTFYGKLEGDTVPLLTSTGYTATTVETYYLYIWLDESETSPSTMDQSFSLSINGMCTNAPPAQTYVAFDEVDGSLRIHKGNTTGVNNDESESNAMFMDNRNYTYNVETIDDLTITEDDNVYFDLENTRYTSSEQLPWYEYRDSIKKIVIEDDISPISTAYWFKDLKNVEYIDLTKLDTSRTTDMGAMFSATGSGDVTTFQIVGLDNFDTYNVKNMWSMFHGTGSSATTFDIGDLSDWDVSNVTSMSYMFQATGGSATTFNIGDLSNWDVSNVTNMYCMFQATGGNATTFSIGDLSNWDVSNVTNMFQMFRDTGISANKFDIGNIGKWNISNVTNMTRIFQNTGKKASIFNVGDLSDWDVSNLINMSEMFYGTGSSASTFDIGNLSDWDVSNVTNMSRMFQGTGKKASIFSIGDLSAWDVSNVTNMHQMFYGTGKSASYTMDLSGWNVNNVTSYNNFNLNVESKIISPIWVN